MSLQTKFAVLLGLLGLIVLLALGAAVLSLEWMHREVRVPQSSMSNAMQKLGDIKRVVGGQRDLIEEVASNPHRGMIDADTDDPEQALRTVLSRDRASVQQSWGGLAQLVQELEADEIATLQTGRSTFTNLRHRLDEAAALVRQWLDLRTEATLLSPPASTQQLSTISADTSERLGLLYKLIERNETKVVSDSAVALAYGRDVRQWLQLLLGLTLLLAGLACALGLVLVRRWVLQPVAALRLATARIGAGDFGYRIPIPVPGAPADSEAGQTAPHQARSSDELLQLSAEVNQMARLVKAMQDERVDRERLAAIGELVRRLAHNLRNPLGGIRNLAELTRQELAAGLPPDLSVGELTENQERIITTVDRFEKWLSGLLNVTRPPRVTPEAHEARNWLTGLVEAYRPMAETRAVTLHVDQNDGPRTAVYDPAQLEQAVVAILSNAIEATTHTATTQSGPPDDGLGMLGRSASGAHRRVWVRSRVVVRGPRPDPSELSSIGPVPGSNGTPPLVARPGGHPADSAEPRIARTASGSDPSNPSFWEISIADEGPGVPPELRDAIFKPYFTTKHDGNGIGLATALQIVRAHGGSITVGRSPHADLSTPEDGKGVVSSGATGAIFVISLPLSLVTGG